MIIAAVVLLAACNPTAQQDAATPSPVEEVVAAERAFAAEAARIGWVEAFEAYAAPDAILLSGAPQNAHENLASIDPANRGDTTLGWSPEYAGASRTGNLGFTTGPFNGGDTAFGQYFTVWKRQADGSLKWIYDGGINQLTPTVVSADSVVRIIESGAEGTDAAIDIANAEADLATAASVNAPGAFAERLTPEGRVNRDNNPSAIGGEAARTLLAGGPHSFTYSPPAKTEVTPDLAWTFGEVRWQAGFGYYSRIWVLTDEGWKIAFDQIIERTPEGLPQPE